MFPTAGLLTSSFTSPRFNVPRPNRKPVHCPFVVAAPISRSTSLLTKRNNNFYEPVYFSLPPSDGDGAPRSGMPWGGIAVFFGPLLDGAVVYNGA